MAPPSFADDISLITLHPSVLQSFMTESFRCSLHWRYELNHTKCGVVTFVESKPLHLATMESRKWVLGNDIVKELHEYKGSISSIVLGGTGAFSGIYMFFQINWYYVRLLFRGCPAQMAPDMV